MLDANKLARFERALLPHLDAAYNLARWLLGREEEAEDAVQDAYVRALTFFDGFHGEDGRGWLLAILRNTCYDRLRKSRRPVEISSEPEELERRPDGAPGPEEQQLRDADRRTVRAALESLTAEYREILVLRELEGMSYKQIAQVAGMPVGTVMSRLARARKRLQSALKESR